MSFIWNHNSPLQTYEKRWVLGLFNLEFLWVPQKGSVMHWKTETIPLITEKLTQRKNHGKNKKRKNPLVSNLNNIYVVGSLSQPHIASLEN